MVLRSSPGANSTIQLRECDFSIKFFFFFIFFVMEPWFSFHSLRFDGGLCNGYSLPHTLGHWVGTQRGWHEGDSLLTFQSA